MSLLPARIRAGPVEAPSLLPGRSLWDHRLARYRRLAAAERDAAETGWFRVANDRFAQEIKGLKRRRLTPEGEILRAAAWERLSEAEDDFWNRCTEPMQKSAVALALTPAPDLEALRVKIAVMREQQLHELERMGRDCFDVLEEDVGRLLQQRPFVQDALR